ncbi:hypothetical protein [Tabrizicola thermarum]|uniref:hypothetical protein n=1 Tax=Tabrizicola thermarum TaxID=2670345 RepID=UPI000FFB902E|nr:hypothetical protein [Tabrizicola thermarum]
MSPPRQPFPIRIDIQIDDPTDPNDRAAVLAVIAVRLCRASGDCDVPASPAADLIHAAALHTFHSLKPSEPQLTELLQRAAAFAAQAIFAADAGTAAPDPEPPATRH